MSAGYPLVNPRFKGFVQGTNAPLSGGLVYFYSDPGFSIFAPVYAEIGCTTPLSNPVVLDVYGEAEIFGNIVYYIRVADANDVRQYTISGVSFSPAAGVVSQSDWLLQSGALNYISTTSFTIAGNQTGVFHTSRRIKVLVTAGTLYGTVVSSSFGAATTVVVSMDSGSLDSGLSAVSVGLLDSQNTSIPNLNPLPTTTGGTTAYLLNVQRGDLIAGTRIQVIINATNTGASTLAINAGAVTPIKKFGAVALSAGDLRINQIADLEFDGTNWQLLNPYNVAVISYGATDSGAVNAYVTTTTPNQFTSLINGQSVTFVPANTNTTASTINVNGTGVIAITKYNSTALSAGDIVAGQPTTIVYNGTSWVLSGTTTPIGNVQLKSAVSHATSGSATQIDIVMNDYSFFPNIQSNLTTALGTLSSYPQPGGNTTDTIGRFTVGPVSGEASVTYWRYLNACDDPTLWAAVDNTGEIKGMWVSDDPLPGNIPGISSPGCTSVQIQREDLSILVHLASPDSIAKGTSRASSPDRIPFRILEVEWKNMGMEIINRCKVVNNKLTLK